MDILKDHILFNTLDAVGEGIVLIDSGSNIVFINSRAKSFAGGEIHAGQKFKNVFIVYESIRNIISDFEIGSCNDQKPLYITFANCPDFSLKYTFTCKIIEAASYKYCITIKERDEQLVSSEKKYKGLFENALEGIFVLGNDGKIIDANPAACQIYRMDKQQLLQMTVRDIFPHKEEAEAWEIWKNFLATGYLVGFYKFVTDSGEKRYIDFKAKTNYQPGLHLAVFSDVTDKRETERAYKISEANLKAIFNSSNQLIILIDNDFRIVTANTKAQKSAKKYLGRDLIPGESILDYGDLNLREQALSVLERVKKGENISYEHNPKHLTDKSLWLEVFYIPVLDQKGNVRGICINTVDITARKMAELSLQENEARFRSLVQNSSDIICVLNQDAIITYVSPSVARILGYSNERLTGKNYRDYIHKDELIFFDELLAQVRGGDKGSYAIEYRFLHAEGYYVNVETNCNNLLDDPYIKGLVLNTRDVTERKYQEENLLLLDRAIDSSKNGIIITDPNQPDNPIIYTNKAFEQITGYNYAEIIGKNCRFLQRDDRRQPEVEKLRRAIRDQKEASVIFRNYRKDGSLFWNELHVSPVFNRSGTLTNFIGVLNDITERKIAEETLLKVTHGISGGDPYQFFDSLLKYLAISLNTEIAIIGEISNTGIITKAFFKDGILEENIHLSLINSPLKHIKEGNGLMILEQVKTKGFEDSFFTDNQIDSYAGVPLIDSSGRILGVLALMSRFEFSNLPLIETLLNIFSAKASAEFERDKHVNALKTSEGKFRNLAENSPDIIYIINLRERKIEYFNRKVIFGYSSQDLEESDAWVGIVHPDDVVRVTNHWKRFLKSSGNAPSSIEYRLKTKAGEYEWVINRHSVIERNTEALPSKVLLNITVITTRKKAEEALRESQARLSGLIENTKDLIWSVDKDLNITTINSSFKNLCKTNFNKMVSNNDNLGEIFPSEIINEWKPLHDRALKGERIFIESSVFPDKFSYEISFNPIYSEDGEITGVSVFARDITERKLAENDIIRTNFELDSFVYRASHDLRAPLRSVLGLVNLVKSEDEKLQREYYLGLVDKSINKLDTFIADLTDFSRNSRLEINVEKISFHNILKDTIENLKYMDHAEELKIKSNFQISVPFYSDSRRISIIFQNLLSNAIKYQNIYKEDSQVLVEVSTNPFNAFIRFSDNGKGIREEYLDKIFNMFFRASQESYGSGLGLYITKQVIEKLGGSITVHSKLGEGTTFNISLPNLQK
ncbi:MAG: PAS domain S-box protein [Cytophagaceae bacterium]